MPLNKETKLIYFLTLEVLDWILDIIDKLELNLQDLSIYIRKSCHDVNTEIL